MINKKYMAALLLIISLTGFQCTNPEKRNEKEPDPLSRGTEPAQAGIKQMGKDIKFRLTALSREFVIGQPMLFRVEMTNVSKSPIEFELTMDVMVNDPMIVKGPDGNLVPYVDTGYQIPAQSEVVQPRETVALAVEYDVTSQYRIIKPGRYTFQFNGCRGYGMSPSNVVEIDVKPGELSPADIIVERLLKILPEGWTYTRTVIPIKPAPGNPCYGFVGVQLMSQKCIGVSIGVYLTENGVMYEPAETVGYLWGKCEWGPVYGEGPFAERLWPDYRKQIIKALDIKKVKPRLKELL